MNKLLHIYDELWQLADTTDDAVMRLELIRVAQEVIDVYLEDKNKGDNK